MDYIEISKSLIWTKLLNSKNYLNIVVNMDTYYRK